MCVDKEQLSMVSVFFSLLLDIFSRVNDREEKVKGEL